MAGGLGSLTQKYGIQWVEHLSNLQMSLQTSWKTTFSDKGKSTKSWQAADPCEMKHVHIICNEFWLAS
jgi:hypothetical protein